jgi:carboxypeptidase C (cathepsin A)
MNTRSLPLICTFLMLFLFTAVNHVATASNKPSDEPAKNQSASQSKAEPTVTRHRIVINGTAINYTATAGMMTVRNAKDEPWASMGFFAYTRNDVSDPSRRPITFAYNGGPGSASIWLHMGALGPRRIVTVNAAPTPPPPYRIVDNEFSILDKTDLVMIDPVGTGFSRAIGEAQDKDFWGVDVDIESVSRFIRQYITANGRWNSPKYLLGESYGTTRSAGVVDYLQINAGMALNGVILVSMATDLDWILNNEEDRSRHHLFPLFLPSYAAAAWYHKALPEPPAELGPFLDEARAFALGEYAHALALGSNLPEAERKSVTAKLRRFTGLSTEYLDRADLRVNILQFIKELFRDRREVIGILDARFLGVSFNPLGEMAEFDSMELSAGPPFIAAFQDYLHRDLNFGPTDRAYIEQAEAWKTWDYRHKINRIEIPQQMVNTGVDLAHAMGYNPSLRVLVLQGIFDLGTPFLATEYMVSHLDLRPDFRSHIEIKYYDAGHMMYLHEPSLKKFKTDVASFIDQTNRL